ncbi:cytochrome P450 [Sediminibacillus massiliensis]|uniref:cytochrome P450 n=1 Tax=Sediminibacillus massiliensis TaxID=1926277 RepID=UPI0009886310|nr:cytochrome P450 [Sediminibacillus massiliensis]
MPQSRQIPKETGMDHSVALMSEGYLFIPNRCRRFQSDIFETRLLGGQKVICMSGAEAAEIFYDNQKFQRKGATPKAVQKTLFGVNAIQSMDGERHKHRKQLFMSLMTPDRIHALQNIAEEQWEYAIKEWLTMPEVNLFEEARQIMCRTACQWSGVPLRANELKQRSSDLAAMVDAFGAAGPRHFRGRQARKRSERWIKGIVEEVRAGVREPAEGTALYEFSWYRDLDGNLLDSHMAGVEILNILRPIVAIAYFIVFGAMALHSYPDTKDKLVEDDGTYHKMFVQEVRRFYPFAPFTGARVKNDFTWRNHQFTKGTLVLLDIYGTNHHNEIWDQPNRFMPERFKDWNGSPFNFIPQGGGEFEIGHRCAGEWVTIDLMQISMEVLTQKIEYQVPPQDFSIPMDRMPTIPMSRMLLTDVERKV